MRVYKFRLYPNKEQEQLLFRQFDLCRFTYNQLLEELGRNKDRKHIQHYIVELKKKYPDLKKVYSKTLQYECYRLFSNLRGLGNSKKKGNKVGRLRFKGRNWFKTIVYNQSGFKIIKTSKRYDFLSLSKVGEIRLLQHREVEGNIKGIIIKRKVGSWEAHIITDAEYSIKKGNDIIGIDLGVISFLTDSKGNKVGNPLCLSKSLGKLRRLQQDLSRKKRGSNNRRRARILVAKLHEKIENQRDDFLHKITTKLVNQNKFIAVEKLNIQGLQQKVWNARNIADSSWGKFISLLKFKAESAGIKVVEVNPKNTSKECHVCGNLQDMPLWKRQYECLYCGTSIDRDTNSAINILGKGFACAEGSVGFSGKHEAISSTPEGVRL